MSNVMMGVTGGYDEVPCRERVVIAIDCSGSTLELMQGAWEGCTRLDAMKKASLAFIRRKVELQAKDPRCMADIGVVAFNDGVVDCVGLLPCDRSMRALEKLLEFVNSDGGTGFCPPLTQAGRILARGRRRASTDLDRLIFMSDGWCNQDGDPVEAADSLKEEGVIIDTIGVAAEPPDVDEDGLRAISSLLDGKARYRFISDCRQLTDCFISLAGGLSG